MYSISFCFVYQVYLFWGLTGVSYFVCEWAIAVVNAP